MERSVKELHGGRNGTWEAARVMPRMGGGRGREGWRHNFLANARMTVRLIDQVY